MDAMQFPVIIESFETPQRFFLAQSITDFPVGKRFTILNIDNVTERDVYVLKQYCYQDDDIPF